MKTITGLLLLAAALPVVADQSGRTPPTDREWQYEWTFGNWAKDPYRWMENRDTPELYTWVKQQNEHTKSVLSGALYAEMKSEFQNIFGGEAESIQDEDFVIDDIIKGRRSPAGVTSQRTSPGGQYELDYSGSERGDFSVVKITDTTTGKPLNEILYVKFDNFIWDDGDRSFVYQTDSDGRMGNAYTGIFRHTIGTSQLDDQLILEAARPDTWLDLRKTGKKYLLIESDEVTTVSEFDLTRRSRRVIVTGLKNRFVEVELTENELIVISDDKEDLGEVLSISLADGNVTTLVAASPLPLDSAVKSDNTFLLTYIKDTAHELVYFDLDSKSATKVPTPGIGRVRLGGTDSGKFLYSYNSFTENSSSWSFDPETVTTALISAAKPTEIELESQRIFYTAHNGHQVPVWIVKKKGLSASPDSPAYLYGYGGFSVNILPGLSRDLMPFLKRGGIYASATLPGGLEYGEAWHRAGARHNKLNVFRDFAEAAKALVATGLTSHDHLAIGGVSNGGTLVGSTLSLYPELFKAAVPQVGVLDMTMFQDHTGGKWWKSEYGNAKIRADYNYLLKYSPYHIVPDRKLPHTLVMTGDLDDRVVPSHSYKFAARTQALKNNPSQALLYTQRYGSHSPYSGGSRSVVEGLATKWTFILQATSGALD